MGTPQCDRPFAIAICAEVIATVSMKAVKGFSTPLPLILVITGYAIAFWMLTLVVRSIPVGIAYAIWSGLGIVLITAVAWLWQKQRLDAPALVGLALILWFFVDQGTGFWHWAKLIGVVPLATGLFSTCPLYALLGLSTCPMKKA